MLTAGKKEWDGRRSRREGAEEKWELKSIKVTDAVRAERNYQWNPLHGQFLRAKVDAEEHRDELRKGQAKKETEGFITAAQSQALRKNSKKNHLSTSRTSRQNSG